MAPGGFSNTHLCVQSTSLSAEEREEGERQRKGTAKGGLKRENARILVPCSLSQRPGFNPSLRRHFEERVGKES